MQKRPTLNLSQPCRGREPSVPWCEGQEPNPNARVQSWKDASKLHGVIRDFLVLSAHGEPGPFHIPSPFPTHTESVAGFDVFGVFCLRFFSSLYDLQFI